MDTSKKYTSVQMSAIEIQGISHIALKDNSVVIFFKDNSELPVVSIEYLPTGMWVNIANDTLDSFADEQLITN